MGDQALELRVTLTDVAPVVWREFVVPDSISLHGLHSVLQCVMGWTNTHSYEFEIDEIRYAPPSPDDDLDSDVEDSNVICVADLRLNEGDSFRYMYDFGDGWEHEVLLQEVKEDVRLPVVPRCLDGERACPPEDCGGPPGYADLRQAVSDASQSERKEILEWLGTDFDPERFDLREVNAMLDQL